MWKTCRSEAALTLSLNVGSRIPVATTAMGRAYLAVCTSAARAALLERIRAQDEAAWPGVRARMDESLPNTRRWAAAARLANGSAR
jgi:DNA-binding IclR family transcriptional regulator